MVVVLPFIPMISCAFLCFSLELCVRVKEISLILVLEPDYYQTVLYKIVKYLNMSESIAHRLTYLLNRIKILILIEYYYALSSV